MTRDRQAFVATDRSGPTLAPARSREWHVCRFWGLATPPQVGPASELARAGGEADGQMDFVAWGKSVTDAIACL